MLYVLGVYMICDNYLIKLKKKMDQKHCWTKKMVETVGK